MYPIDLGILYFDPAKWKVKKFYNRRNHVDLNQVAYAVTGSKDSQRRELKYPYRVKSAFSCKAGYSNTTNLNNNLHNDNLVVRGCS